MGLLVISGLLDPELVEIPERPPFVPVDEKSPLYLRTALKHKRPSASLRNLQVMLILRSREPNRITHVEKIMP